MDKVRFAIIPLIHKISIVFMLSLVLFILIDDMMTYFNQTLILNTPFKNGEKGVEYAYSIYQHS